MRSPSDAAARKRLRASFGSADQALLAAFDELAEDRLTVHAGKDHGAQKCLLLSAVTCQNAF